MSAYRKGYRAEREIMKKRRNERRGVPASYDVNPYLGEVSKRNVYGREHKYVPYSQPLHPPIAETLQSLIPEEEKLSLPITKKPTIERLMIQGTLRKCNACEGCEYLGWKDCVSPKSCEKVLQVERNVEILEKLKNSSYRNKISTRRKHYAVYRLYKMLGISETFKISPIYSDGTIKNIVGQVFREECLKKECIFAPILRGNEMEISEYE